MKEVEEQAQAWSKGGKKEPPHHSGKRQEENHTVQFGGTGRAKK